MNNIFTQYSKEKYEGYNAEVDAIFKKRNEDRYIDELLKKLDHYLICVGRCNIKSCNAIKKYVAHVKICRKDVCDLCGKLKNLFIKHSMQCFNVHCSIPYCNNNSCRYITNRMYFKDIMPSFIFPELDKLTNKSLINNMKCLSHNEKKCYQNGCDAEVCRRVREFVEHSDFCTDEYCHISSRVKKFKNYAKKCNDIKSKIEDKTAIKTEDKTDSESDDKNEEDTIPCSSQ
jgi:hypothetical protein